MRRLRQDDVVEVLSGKDRGRRGQIRELQPEKGRVIVQGVNIVKKHMKARQLGTQAGIIEVEAPLHWSKVAVVCLDCDHRTRVGFRRRTDGVKVRFCRRCEEDLD
ncbi:MAG: 50S ribosomal protein L24 [Chloroflexota bacterium]|nr:50S ribosomal protein L24 [Chloroflexota bacterium]MDE2640829.1 50S ribosomal protein L24 [Chloroflexota bacterium]